MSAVAAPKREAGDVPERLEQGRADLPLGHQRVEALEVALFLARHAGDEVRRGRALAEHGELAGVDARRAIFAGLVDAQHRGAVDLAVAGARRSFAARSTPARK